jgi:para-aminobenzoate synthetase component I
MWSDRLPPDRLQALIAEIHAALPIPSGSSSEFKRKLAGHATIPQVAERLHTEPGFSYVHRTTHDGTSAPILLHKPLATITYWSDYADITGPGGTRRVMGRGFEILEAALEAWKGASGALLAGFLSYDLAFEIEDLGRLPKSDFRFPLFEFSLYDSHLTFEDETWFYGGTNAWRNVEDPGFSEELLRRAADLTPPHAEATTRFARVSSSLTSTPDRSEFEASVQRIVATIHSGDIFQTNLCRKIEASLPHDAEWQLFQRLRSVSPARYEAFLSGTDPGDSKAGMRAVLSISPELFLKVDRGMVQSSPIKGTRPRGKNAEEDRVLCSELLASEKDRAELAMIVDVVRNDLGRVCEIGSVGVKAHAELMTLPTVHHSYSTVLGRLRKDAGTIGLLRAAFPAASISGAPKIEAIRVAVREERQPRGPCMGAIGWISLDGSLELSVVIRTAFASEGRVRYYGGCGITAASVPNQEFEESRHKIAAFVRALGAEEDPNW